MVPPLKTIRPMADSILVKLLASKNPISVSPMFCIILLSLIINVKSSDYFFNFPTFSHGALGHIFLANDASIGNEVLELTKKDQDGYPLKTSVGQARLHKPIHIYDNITGKVADFTTEFSFVTARNEVPVRGDGMAFFFIPHKIKSAGGLLGMFTNDNALNSKDQIVLVEFGSFENDWDPYYPKDNISHLGIDVSSIKSVATDPWNVDYNPDDGATGTAHISYDSKIKKFSVSVTYPYESTMNYSSLVHYIDLTTVLPEEVLIGFSAATGDSVETHDILSWSFASNL